ncbi:MAG: hypothetical protein JO140_04110, partial [Candidatus Eremiobacteraeota bacterium]|nr:hypothetical protein [Candidatus Eremiobacteraeota bacterium]
PLTQIIHNAKARELLWAAANAASESDPVLDVGEKNWHVLNCVLNAMAEPFASSVIRQDLEPPAVKSQRYVFCLTCEPKGDDNERKVRVLLIRKDFVDKVSSGEEIPNKFEDDRHKVRLQTLHAVLEKYKQCKPLRSSKVQEEKDRDPFMEIELYV